LIYFAQQHTVIDAPSLTHGLY